MPATTQAASPAAPGGGAAVVGGRRQLPLRPGRAAIGGGGGGASAGPGRVNRKLVDEAPPADRAVDAFVGYFGSLKYLRWQTCFIAVWVAVNSIAWAFRWDPYPWILLNLIFSTRASYAAPLILLSQNRAAEHDRLKAEHDFEVNQAALDEIRAIGEHLGMARQGK